MNRVTSSWWYIRDGVVHRRYRFVDVPCVCTREFGALSGAARAPTTLTLTRQSLCTRLHVDAVRRQLRQSKGLWDTRISGVWVHPDDDDHIFAGSHSGVYESTDAAASSETHVHAAATRERAE